MPRKSFPAKLYQMLEHAAMYQHRCISWQSHGRCFRVHDKKRFEQELMPLFFKTRLYENFRKSLNNYGFKLIQGINNPDRGCYYHSMFIRSQHSLCLSMKLLSTSREKELRNSSPSRGLLMPFQEPNFYRRNHTSSEAAKISTSGTNCSNASLISSKQSISSKSEITVATINNRNTKDPQEFTKIACVSPIDTDMDEMKIDFDISTLQVMKMLLPEDPRVLCNVFD